MKALNRRKRYFDGDENINDTAKYRTIKIASVEESSNQTGESSNLRQPQAPIGDIPPIPETEEPDAITSSDDDSLSEDGISSNDEEFHTSMLCETLPQNLHDLLQTPGFCNTISTPVERSPAELLLMVLKYSIANKLPLTSTSNLMQLINSIFTMPVTPESRYMIDKFCNSKHDAEFHATCPNCTMYIGKLKTLDESAKCTNCNTVIDVSSPSSTSYFAIVDPSDAVADYLNAYEDHYSFVMKDRRYEKGRIRDVYDGKCYRSFVDKLPECAKQQYATAAFNTDGAPVFESSTYSIWPIYIMINELPAEHRFNKLIVCGLWFGKTKPQMSIFLDTFVDKMNELSTVGIPCTIKKEALNVKLYSLICCVDTVARSPMNGTMQFNAFFGCDWCLHPGEWVSGSMRYPLLECIVQDRDMENTIKLMREAVQKGLPICGVRNASPLINLIFFDIIRGFVPDYLHCFLAGVAKQLTEYLIKSVTATDLNILEVRVSKIKAPNQIGRLSRDLKERGQWKAREWENWLLYYSIPVLETVIDIKKLKHWSLIVESLHILLRTDITCQELDKADRMLHEFVCGMEQIYSKTAMTYNVHQLLHIARSVYDWGPLWAHSTFPFESGNHQLLTSIHCARGVNQQILRYVNMHRTVNILEKHLYPYSSPIVERYCSSLGKPQTKKCLQKSGITYFGRTTVTDQKLVDEFQLSPRAITFMRMVKNGCLYASAEKKNPRSCNSFAQLSNKAYIKILKFVVDEESDKQLVLCNNIQTISSEFAESLHKVIEIQNDIIAVEVNDIDKVCTFLHVTERKYVCSVPNLYKY